MRGLNPYMDQGVDIRLLTGSCPMEGLYDSDEDIEFITIPAWRMKDGKLIAIRDMDTSHIKNCIKMIYRTSGTWRHQYLRYFEAELRKRKFLKNPPAIVYINIEQ